MQKPDDLRAWLTNAVPVLKREPERLQVFIDKGAIVATGARGLAYEYRYTLTLQLLDYAGDPDGVMAPILVWVAINQPELLGNPERQANGIQFEADILDGDKVDLQVQIALTERVKISPQGAGRFHTEHLAEPPFPDGEHPLPAAPGPDGFNRLYKDDELIAEWPSP
ncbi:MAG: phage tail protein [Phenylobacterium sp.]|nr:phage tail protein [Phenylobacterium sp.]